MGYEWLAVAMFVGFFFILMSGYPVAFSFAAAAMLFGGIRAGRLRLRFQSGASAPQPLVWHDERFHFVGDSILCLFGIDLEKSGLAEEIC
jgi:TRAP-type mannitol/chloroaromatic compound transport system permease large subunit